MTTTLRKGQRVAIRLEGMMSGTYDGEATVTRYDPPPSWLPDGAPVIWVRPKGWKHDVSITLSDLTE